MPAIVGTGIRRARFVEELPPVATARENTLYVLTTAMPNPTMHVLQDGEYVQVGGAGAGAALEAIIDLGAVASLRNPAADSVNGLHFTLGDRGQIPARDPVLNPSALATNADLDSGNIPTSGGIVRWNNPMVVSNRPAHDPDDTILYYYTGSVPDQLEFSDGADYYRVSGWVQDQGGSLVFDDDVSWANVDPDQAVQFTFGNGEFANDAELLAYIIEHHGEFKRRFDAGVPRVAYYNTTGDSVRIAQITNIGRLAVEAVDEPAARSILSNIQKITGPAFDDLLAGDLTWDETPYYEPFRVLDEGVIGMSQSQLAIGRSEGGNNSAWEYERDVGNVLADDVHMVNRADIVSQFIDNRGLPHLGAAFQFVSRANVLGYLRYEQQFFAQLLREDGITKLIWANTADDGLFVADYDPTGESGNTEQRPVESLEIAASVPVPDSILNETAVDVDAFEQKSTEIRWHDPPVIASVLAIDIAARAPQFEAFYDLNEQLLRYWRADVVQVLYWTSNSVGDPFVSGVSWADISASDSDRYAAGTGRFADDDALRDFIVENYALFRTRFAAGQTRVAWFRESDETLRVSTIAKMLAQFFDNTMLTDTPEDANDWTLRGRQRDVGTAAVAGQDAAFSASALAVDADIDGGSLNAQWASPMVGTGQGFPGSTTENMAFFDTFDTQHRFRYYDADQTRLSRVLSDAELWDDDITLADVSGNNGVPGYDVAGGEFADDAAVLAYIQANEAIFRARHAAGRTRIAYVNTTSNTVRIGNYTPSVAGTAQVDAAPLSIEIDETDQHVTINYSPAADGLITDADTMGEIQTAALDLVLRGLANRLFGTAAAGTDVTRPVPWEVSFAGGATVTITFDGVAGGPDTNVFMGATEQDAINALNAYTAANPTWADAYQADQRLTVALRWGAGDGTTYLRDTTGMWRDIGLVWLKGQRGIAGVDGDDGTDGTDGTDGEDYDSSEVLAARDRAEAAATAAEASQTAADASATAAGGSALTADAAESDASDSRVAAGMSQMSATDSATAAETSADRAERFAAQSQTAAQGDPRGSVLATSPALPVASRGPNSRYPFGTNRWTVTADGVAAGLTAGGTDEEHLFFPHLAPAGLQGYWLQVLVGGVVVGEAHRPHGYHTTSRNHFPLLERIYAGQDSSDDAQFLNVDWRATVFELFGSGTTLSANTTVRVLESVVRGAKGDQGDPGVGITQAQYDALVARVAVLEAAGGVTPPSMHTRYFGFSLDRVIETADLASANTSMDDEGELPANVAPAYPYFAVPEDVGAPDELEFPPNPVDQILFYTRQAGTINDDNGDAHIVFVANNQLPISAVARAMHLIYN